VSDLSRIFNDLVRFEIAVWDAVDARLKSELSLPLTHYEPMSVMGRIRNCRVHDIAAELGITPGGVSKLVDRIEASGYSRRLPNPRDRRSSLVELTPEGERVLAAAAEALEDELGQWFGEVLPERTLRQLGSTLARLRAADHSTETEATA
jgi:MarR family transcriptional regulator, organic hydroperoxide resistance regulator